MPWWLTAIIVIETLPMFLGPIFALNNPAFLMFGLASNEIRLIAIFVIGYYIPALVALRFLLRQMTEQAATVSARGEKL